MPPDFHTGVQLLCVDPVLISRAQRLLDHRLWLIVSLLFRCPIKFKPGSIKSVTFV